MYHIQTNELEYTDKTYQYVLSQKFAPEKNDNPAQLTILRSIADQSFDLLSQAQKMEKLQKLNRLSETENKEYISILRLVGTMIHILRQYQYSDFEMMDTLVSRFQKYENLSKQATA